MFSKKRFSLLSVVFVLSFLVCGPVSAMGGPAPTTKPAQTSVDTGGRFLIDNFESGNLRSPREWWTFDIKKAEVVSNSNYKDGDAQVASSVGNYSLLCQGEAKNWYVGGCGTYLAKEGQDLSKYNFLQVDIYGGGPGSGTFKVELLDDDNRNWQVEQDPAKSYSPVYDDKFVYDVVVDWQGWKKVIIPLADFVDSNPGVGDDVWNPQQKDGSGGLLQLQFVCLAATDKGMLKYNLDNIMLLSSDK